ncbi:cytochrome P450 [Niveispirillum sp.]|uniref:cytochrome P450 n=1 Tax=Niveispirillum sp. TaxID=1917217 RepID=UPI001B45742F|nr:cytochrome P450 [Niveispirillum sp.]MBP7338460.1 cytochrome P450 [Niveispirillum sp.]
MPQAQPVIPNHVPPHLVRDFSYWKTPGMAPTPNGNPQAALSFVHREGPPLFYAPANTYDGRGTWVVTRAEDQRRILQNPEVFSSNRGIFMAALGEDLPMVPLEKDPPDHQMYRALLNPLLSPKRVDAMEAGARERAVRLIEGFKDKGSCEIMNDFAFPFAVGVFLQFLGVSDDRRDEFLGWANDQFHGTLDQRLNAMRTVVNFMKGLIDLRKREPAEDFVGFLLKADVQGRPLTDKEILGIAVLLFEAGLDTVAAAVGFDLYHLARHPDDQQRLRDDRDLIKPAVEEFFRAYSTIQMLRKAVKDYDFDGIMIKAGDLVSCPTMIANRDPAEFPDPDRIDLARDNNRHTAFAYGPHRCLGSHLARRELIIGLEEFLARIPTFRIKQGTAPVTYGGYVFGIENLVLDWT